MKIKVTFKRIVLSVQLLRLLTNEQKAGNLNDDNVFGVISKNRFENMLSEFIL